MPLPLVAQQLQNSGCDFAQVRTITQRSGFTFGHRIHGTTITPGEHRKPVPVGLAVNDTKTFHRVSLASYRHHKQVRQCINCGFLCIVHSAEEMDTLRHTQLTGKVFQALAITTGARDQVGHLGECSPDCRQRADHHIHTLARFQPRNRCQNGRLATQALAQRSQLFVHCRGLGTYGRVNHHQAGFTL